MGVYGDLILSLGNSVYSLLLKGDYHLWKVGGSGRQSLTRLSTYMNDSRHQAVGLFNK